MIPELLAPAGSLEAAYAAFQYGADGIYLGLHQFSARAEATNFTPTQLNQIVAYAHSLEIPKKIYLAVNTLVHNHRLPAILNALELAAETGVDAIIVQDIGVAALAQKHFPSLRLHGSTQMSVHNVEGAEALKELGFKRVIPARELTGSEIKNIASIGDLETEVFIHGALCYCYSGLCLYSSMLHGRSGNLGKCTYPCRSIFKSDDANRDNANRDDVNRMKYKGQHAETPISLLPFSMKDIALLEDVRLLQNLGVSSLKIEGRKKSPLYVAATVSLYRDILDGKTGPEFGKTWLERLEDLKTIFSRPWTKLYLSSGTYVDSVDKDNINEESLEEKRQNDRIRSCERKVCDTEVTGHRGARIGKVMALIDSGQGPVRIRFKTERRLEVRDGLQIDPAKPGKPFGFPVTEITKPANIRDNNRGKKVDSVNQKIYVVPPGTIVEVPLPAKHPEIIDRAVIYHSSSQEVKQKFPLKIPRADHVRFPAQIKLNISPEKIIAHGSVYVLGNGLKASAEEMIEDEFKPAKSPGKTESAAQKAFDKMKDSEFCLESLSISNESDLFVPVSLLNELRRNLLVRLQDSLNEARISRKAELSTLLPEIKSKTDNVYNIDNNSNEEGDNEETIIKSAKSHNPLWIISIESAEMLSGLSKEELSVIEEVILNISNLNSSNNSGLLNDYKVLCEIFGDHAVRIGLPVITRSWEKNALIKVVSSLKDSGAEKWEISNISGLNFLKEAGIDMESEKFDMTFNWPVYTMNKFAADKLIELGASRFTLSPEDSLQNMIRTISLFPDQAVIPIYQDVPLFISENCAISNLNKSLMKKTSKKSMRHQTQSPPQNQGNHQSRKTGAGSENHQNRKNGTWQENTRNKQTAVYAENNQSTQSPTWQENNESSSIPCARGFDVSGEQVLISEGGEKVRLIQHGCRSIVVGEEPLDRTKHFQDFINAGARYFRMDFLWKRYNSSDVESFFRSLNVEYTQ